MDNRNIKKLTLLAIWTAVTFVLGRLFTFPIPGSAGNILTLLDVGIYTAVFLFGKREAAIIGGFAAFLLDLTAGYSNYMFFSLIIHGGQGYLAGLTRYKWLNFLLSLVFMVGGYFIVGGLMYGWGSAIAGLWVNIIQVVVGFALEKIKKDTQVIIDDVIKQTEIKAGQVFVLGLSSSEVNGGLIGHASSSEIGQVIVSVIHKTLSDKGIYLAVQACEHLNRALLIEEELAEKKDWEIVSVIPQLHAGGSGQVAAYQLFKSPVEVEHIVANAGLDIGDTSIGMHVKHVQIPVRPILRELGGAHVTALKSRPKLIGGERARYK